MMGRRAIARGVGFAQNIMDIFQLGCQLFQRVAQLIQLFLLRDCLLVQSLDLLFQKIGVFLKTDKTSFHIDRKHG